MMIMMMMEVLMMMMLLTCDLTFEKNPELFMFGSYTINSEWSFSNSVMIVIWTKSRRSSLASILASYNARGLSYSFGSIRGVFALDEAQRAANTHMAEIAIIYELIWIQYMFRHGGENKWTITHSWWSNPQLMLCVIFLRWLPLIWYVIC